MKAEFLELKPEMPKLVLMHIPKTGGTSLHFHFSQHFLPEEICPERFSRLDNIDPNQLKKYKYFSGHYNFQQIRFIPGPKCIVTLLRDPVDRILSNYYFWKRHSWDLIKLHQLRGPEIAKRTNLLEFLRNPEVADSTSNMMTRFLAGGVNVQEDFSYKFSAGCHSFAISDLEVVSMAIFNLSSVDFIGFSTEMHEIYARVAAKFSMKPVSEIVRLNTRHDKQENFDEVADEVINREIKRELNELTRLDRMLYRLARSHVRLRGVGHL